MKTKHALLFTTVLVPVCTVLRILQYIFVIDENGFFKPQNEFQSFLVYSLYILMAAAAVFSGLFLIWGSSQKANRRIFKSNNSGLMFIIIAIIMMADFGVNLAAMLKTQMPDPVTVLELLAAVFYAILGYTILSGSKPKKGIYALGFFAPIYIIAHAIKAFFSSFEKSHVSQVKFNMLILCCMALLVMTVVLLFCGQKVTKKRIVALSLLYAVIASSGSIADLYAAAVGKVYAVSPASFIFNALIQTVFIIISFIVLINADADDYSVCNMQNQQDDQQRVCIDGTEDMQHKPDDVQNKDSIINNIYEEER